MTLEWIHPSDVWLTNDQSMNNAQIVANHLIASGWTSNAISALCGNMAHESSINPDIWEYGYNHSLNRGYGLVQWTPASKYIDWANASGLAWDNGDSQLSRIDWEKQNGEQWITKSAYPLTFDQFAVSTQDPQYLTEVFMNNYERPNAYAGAMSLPARKSFAQQCFTSLDWSGQGTVINPPPSGGGTTPLKNNNTLIALLLSDALNGWK